MPKSSRPIVPQIRYPGGKARIAPWLIEHFPKTVWPDAVKRLRYVEPLAGRGNVYFRVRCEDARYKFHAYWLNDFQTAKFFLSLQQCSEAVIRDIVGYPNVGERIFESFRRRPHDMRAIFLEPYVTYSGMGYAKGSYAPGNHMSEDGKGSAKILPETYISYLVRAAEILREDPFTRITGIDALDVIYSCGEGDFLYLDPPYPGCDVGAYETNDYVLHHNICDALRHTKAKWLLSNYDRDPYRKKLGAPFAKRETTMTMARATMGESRTECLWKNY